MMVLDGKIIRIPTVQDTHLSCPAVHINVREGELSGEVKEIFLEGEGRLYQRVYMSY